MRKNIEPEEETWLCPCGIKNLKEDGKCECGRRRDEETVEVSILKNFTKKSERMIPH